MLLSSRTVGRLGLLGLLSGVVLIPASAGPERGNHPTQGTEIPGSILRGWVQLRPEGGSFTDGTLHIIVENVTKQDVRSRLVAEQIQYHIPYDGQSVRDYPFALGPFAFRPGNTYNIRIHMDADSDGKKTVGDFYQLGVTVFDGQSPLPPNMVYPTEPIRNY